VTVRGQKKLSTVPGYEQRQTAQTAEELRDTVIATENTALAPELEGLVERGLERGHVTLAEVNEALAEAGDEAMPVEEATRELDGMGIEVVTRRTPTSAAPSCCRSPMAPPTRSSASSPRSAATRC